MNGWTRRRFLGMLSLLALLALAGGCAHTAATRAPPLRAWDESEIVRTGRWAG